MLSRWRSAYGAVVVSVATVALVLLDLLDDDVRTWGVDHALTSATVTGLLVLLITVLVVDEVVDLRDARNRSRAVAAQGAILLAQANRAVAAVRSVAQTPGDRDDADQEVRTYMMMLLVSGPLLIDTARARSVLEAAQVLAARLAVVIGGRSSADAVDQIVEAAEGLRSAAEPLMSVLHPAERQAVTGFEQE